MSEREQLEQSIAGLEAHQAVLGDAVVDPAIAALRKQLAELEPPPPTDQQRKQITVLFADVSGFTAMSETMDAEDVTEVMNALWERLDATIVEHGGLIDKHMGDSVMALWGVKQAHEHDPERAVRATLAMQAALAAFRDDQQVGLAMRIGLNTGPVLLGEVGTTGEYTAMGDTVNLASRLEQAAPVGGILISHNTFRHVIGVFTMQPLEPIQVKGKAEPIQVYLVQRAKPRTFRKSTRGVAGVETHMIGRDGELKYLQEAFYAVVEDSERQRITIIGEVGVGKSRLLYEFDVWAELQPKHFYYFKGRASQTLQGTPYGLIRDLFVFRFQIQDNDPPQLVRNKMEGGVADALGESEQNQVKAHFVGQLLGFDFSDSPYLQNTLDDPQQIRDRALIYIGDYFKAMAAHYPVLILLEDLHWADDSSLDALNRLDLAMANRPWLVVGAARPDLFERRPHWGEGQIFHTRLELRPLSRRAIRQLMEEILQKAEQVPDALRELVVGGAEGNPFYVEELINMLIEDGVIVTGEERWHIEPARLTAVRVPSTLTGVLQARLDGLPPQERTALQQASVVGRLFWDRAVERISQSEEGKVDVPPALSALRGREMVFQREDSAFAGTNEYIFKHAILREVTYESVLKRVRRAYHKLVAEWLIEHSGERMREHTGLIADHLELAGQTEQAVTCLRQAGDQAAAQFANVEAINYFSRVLDLTPEANYAERYALLLKREKIYDLQGAREAQVKDLAALGELAKPLGKEQQAEVALRRTHYGNVTSDYPVAIEAAQEAVRLAWAEQAVSLRAAGYLEWGLALFHQGKYEAARSQFEQALALARAAQLRQVEADSLNSLGRLYNAQNDFDVGITCHEQALNIYREIGDQRGESAAFYRFGFISGCQGDYARARAYYEQALSMCREIGDRRGELVVLHDLGFILDEQGDYAGAKAHYKQTLRICREIGERSGEGLELGCLGLVFHHLGNDQTAQEYCQQALQITQDIGNRHYRGDILVFLGHALASLGQLAEAADAYREAIGIGSELGQPTLEMDSLAGLARVCLAQDELTQAQAHVEEILPHLQTDPTLNGASEPFRVYLTCYQVLAANDDPRTLQVLTTAHTLLQERAARIPDDETRRSFLENVAAHREIVAAYRAMQDNGPNDNVRGHVV